MQQENTYNSLLNGKTTLMRTTVNSLWLHNLPFSLTFQQRGWKLCKAILKSEGEEDDGDSGDGDDDFVIKWCHRCVGGLGRAWK